MSDGTEEAGASGNEIITVQVGHYANAVGAHFWNAQHQETAARDGEEGERSGGGSMRSVDLAQDRLFRTGTSRSGRVVRTPRAVMIDLGGSTGPMVAQDDVESYEAKSAAIAWGGTVQRTFVDGGAPPAQRHTGGGGGGGSGAEEEPALWSDILQQPLHGNTMVNVAQYRHGDETKPFNQFGFGRDAFRRAELRDQIDDSVHFFLEECDSPQGIQLMADLTDGFAGLGSGIVESFREDHGKLSVICMGVVPPNCDAGSILNIGQAMVNYSDLVSLLIPASTTGRWGDEPLTTIGGAKARRAAAAKAAEDAEAATGSTFYDASSPYQSSAVLAAAWDAATTGYRVNAGGYSMASMVGALSMDGTRPVAALSGAVPLPLGVLAHLDGAGAGDTRAPDKHSTLSGLLAELADAEEPWMRSDYANNFCPGYQYLGTPYVSCTTVRGFVDRKELLRPADEDLRSGRAKVSVYDRASSAAEAMMRYYGTTNSAGKFFVTEAARGVTPLPGAFEPIVAEPYTKANGGMPTFACVSSDPGVFHTMKDLNDRLRKIGRMDLARFDAGGFGSDELEELQEAMQYLADKYDTSQ